MKVWIYESAHYRGGQPLTMARWDLLAECTTEFRANQVAQMACREYGAGRAVTARERPVEPPALAHEWDKQSRDLDRRLCHDFPDGRLQRIVTPPRMDALGRGSQRPPGDHLGR